MFVNEDGFRQKDERYITSNTEVKCDNEWSEEIFHNFDSYLR